MIMQELSAIIMHERNGVVEIKNILHLAFTSKLNEAQDDAEKCSRWIKLDRRTHRFALFCRRFRRPSCQHFRNILRVQPAADRPTDSRYSTPSPSMPIRPGDCGKQRQDCITIIWRSKRTLGARHHAKQGRAAHQVQLNYALVGR